MAVGVTFPLLGAAGFLASGPNSDSALLALRIVYCLLPVPLLLGAILLLWNFPLTPRRVAIIGRRLSTRRERAEASVGRWDRSRSS